jgi:hypothetical protein
MIIDTPEGIEAYRKLALRGALKLEIETGLRHSRGSVMKLIINENPSITKRTKKGVLAEYEKILKGQGILIDNAG